MVLFFAYVSASPLRLPEIIVADLTLMEGPEEVGKHLSGQNDKRERGGDKPRLAGKTIKTGLEQKSLVAGPVPSETAQPERRVKVLTHQSPSIPASAEETGDRQTAGGREEQGESLSVETGGGYGTEGTAGQGTGGRLEGGSNYYYIRDMVRRNIVYPEKARRMGIEGKVLLSFIVLENGATGEIKVISGSGHRILDQSAKEGVEKTVIHRKVAHHVVSVTLPIVYKLQ
jgi:protein TonB